MRQDNAWYYMLKVRTAMDSARQYLLSEIIHVYEFTIGGKMRGQAGSPLRFQKKTVISVGLSEKIQVKRVYFEIDREL